MLDKPSPAPLTSATHTSRTLAPFVEVKLEKIQYLLLIEIGGFMCTSIFSQEQNALMLLREC